MQAKAVARTVRIAPRKARLVMDLIRGKQVGEAVSILNLTPRAASPIIEKVLNLLSQMLSTTTRWTLTIWLFLRHLLTKAQR